MNHFSKKIIPSGVSIIGVLASAQFSLGEMVSPLREARVVGKLDRRVLMASQDIAKEVEREGLELGVTTSLTYDDNILQTAQNQKADTVLQVEPAVSWTTGQRERTWVRLAYQGAAVIYFSENDESRLDHRVSLEGGYRRKAILLAFSADWAKVGSPSADLGGASERQEWGLRGAVGFDPKGKWSYELFGEVKGIDQEASFASDIWQQSGGVLARFDYSPKTQFEFGLQSGEIDVDGGGIQEFQRLMAQIAWAPRPKFNLSLASGLEHRSYEVGSGWDPFVAARAEWRPRRFTTIYLEGYYREEASAALIGENYNLGGVRAGVRQRVRDGWSAGLEIGRETADYFSVNGGLSSGRKDVITFIRPTLRYEFGDDSELVFLYQWSQNDSTDARFGYDNNQVGVSLNYRF